MIVKRLQLPQVRISRTPSCGERSKADAAGCDPTRTYSWIYAFNQYIVAEGYVVLSVNYRGGTGYGLDYQETDNLGPGGGSDSMTCSAPS
jgi:hypothetical protein